MTASSGTTPSTPVTRGSLRLRLAGTASAGNPDGAWWPWSRSLQAEAADLVDHFPDSVGYLSRLLFSRPDWDDSVAAGRGVRRILAARGPVKVGSFPDDDTHLMIVTMSSGRRLKLVVIPSDISRIEGERMLEGAGMRRTRNTASDRADLERWDDEGPHG